MSKASADNKNLGGRPRTGIGQFIGVRLNPAQLTALDSWRSKHPEKPNRPEAIRLMIGEATSLQKVQTTPRERPAARVIRALEQAVQHARGEDVGVIEHHVQVPFGRPDEPFGARLRPIKGGKTPRSK